MRQPSYRGVHQELNGIYLPASAEEQDLSSTSLPAEIVSELDKHVVVKRRPKRAVAMR